MDRKGPASREPYEIFREACHEFRSSLTEKDKALFKEFSDAKSMLTTIKEDTKSHPVHSSTLTQCCKGINSIENRLSPFFDIAGLFVSSHPEFAALAWGSLRLVFVLGSNHAKFLERVCDMFESMSMILPAYSTIWRPFDIRYDDLIQRWKDHREIFELEMSITANIQQFETGDRVDELLKRVDGDWGAKTSYTRDLKDLDIDSLLIRLKSWIDPPTWAYAFENTQHRRSERTTEWFLKHGKVSRWLLQATPERTLSALSVQGKPGYGKTTLRATLIEHIQTCYTSSSTHESVAVVYFFFDRQRQANSTAMAAPRAILVQLLHIFRKDEAILDIITLLWDQNKSGQVTASGSEIISALCLLSSRVSKLFMAIDGVDECQDHEDLFDYLKEICQYSNSVSIALFGRPSMGIPQDLSSMLQRLDLTSTMNFESLEIFLRPKIQQLARDGVISSEKSRDQVVKLLASRANGMFLQRREGLKDLNHGGAPFLPWHRYFGVVYERALRDCGYEDPYTASESTLKCVTDGPFAKLRPEYLETEPKKLTDGGHCLHRNLPEVDEPDAFATMAKGFGPEGVEEVQASGNWSQYARSLEGGPHGSIHACLGGEMNPTTFPNEPLFFLHHAQIDRLWWLWQEENSTRLTEYNGLYKNVNQTEQHEVSLDDVMMMGGINEDLTVGDVMDTNTGPSCYTY
ncbi:monophenol monooxygenase (tyrosinase) [Fusarium agapanthi]|uniref:Monophenol monooxygenase (Tyrosinase) n=1 Tax=Fusarium agapanthi TaxID=1803897 RepID=A0A9P5BEY1_9HYPO|nr:monophenol monooxygenase (tyrosinase) [Fusarium agapanthi]